MKRMGKRIAVVGAGAVGGYVGAHLTAGGHDVTLIDPWPEHVETMKANGMEIFGMTPETLAYRASVARATSSL